MPSAWRPFDNVPDQPGWGPMASEYAPIPPVLGSLIVVGDTFEIRGRSRDDGGRPLMQKSETSGPSRYSPMTIRHGPGQQGRHGRERDLRKCRRQTTTPCLYEAVVLTT